MLHCLYVSAHFLLHLQEKLACLTPTNIATSIEFKTTRKIHSMSSVRKDLITSIVKIAFDYASVFVSDKSPPVSRRRLETYQFVNSQVLCISKGFITSFVKKHLIVLISVKIVTSFIVFFFLLIELVLEEDLDRSTLANHYDLFE